MPLYSPTFIAIGAGAAGYGDTLTPTIASTSAVDDIAIAQVRTQDNQLASFPAGWTTFVDETNTSLQRCFLAWKRVTSADIGASVSITRPNATVFPDGSWAAVISSWRGCVLSGSPIDAAGYSVAKAASAQDIIDYADFDPAESTAFVVAMGFYNQPSGGITPGTVSGTDPTFAANYYTLNAFTGTIGSSTGAATGARTQASNSVTDQINMGILFGLIKRTVGTFASTTGVFAKETSGTANATNTISCGFAPKAVILWATLNTSQDAFLGGLSQSFGFSDGTTQYCAAIAVEDGAATSDANRYHHNAASVVVLNSTDGSLLVAGSVSFSGNDVVITWTTNTTTAYLVHYLVLGGSDLTNAKVINTFEASTTVQSQDRTGFGFDPDFLLFTHDSDDTDPPVGDAIALLHIGAIADKASHYELMAFMGSEDAAAAANNETHLADDASITRTALMGQALKAGTFINNGIATVTFITDGYNANWTSAASAAWHYGVLALKGLQYDLERDLCPTSTGDDSLTGFGFQPEALLAFMSPVASGFEGDSDINLGIGAATSTSDEHAAWVGDNDAADPTEVDQRSTATYMVLGAAPGTPTVDKQASLVEFLSDGFKQNWATVPATAHYQGWIAFGPAAATGNRSPAFAQII